MTGPLDSVEALLPPEHGIIIVAGAAADFLDDLFAGEVPLCSAGDDILYLMSASDSYHCARVVLESWAATPPDDRQDADAQQQVTLALSEGTVHVSGMLEFQASPILTLGPPGRYHAQVSITGRSQLCRIAAQPDHPIPIMDAERFRVRFWAADN
ncbi:hypothetical protein GCM10010169_16280 [Micromonospora fulviviridis]|uniref:hypothetical protein n=1 Tax=Micromonospora fulviviridis TaxID=47860 RepID=UPI001666006C|nr:hypothetical protein [Micromonospora fulviviridis]GGR73027.1 hypothetical protein GCM10010169_16280 [Micromonospora fulviviridis]